MVIITNSNFIAQDKTIDSLKLALKSAKHDTTKCRVLYQLAETAADNEWPAFNEELKTLSEKNLKIHTTNDYLHQFYLKYLAVAYNNFGFLYQQKGDIVKALEYYSTCLNIQEQTGNKAGIAESLNNIGAIYRVQNNATKALDYYFKSLKLQKEINDKYGMSQTLNNIGLLYYDRGNLSKSFAYFEKNLKIQIELGDKNGISASYNNIGANYQQLGDMTKALEYYQKSLKIQEEEGNKDDLAISLVNVGFIYFTQKKYHQALEFGLKAMKISEETNSPEPLRNAAKLLSNIYKIKGDSKKALENFELFIKMQDSISNQETRKATIKSQLKYEYEKKAAADSIKVVEEKKIIAVQFKQEQNQRYFLYAGLGLTLFFGGFIFNRFRVAKKQKNIIEAQKILVEAQKLVVEEKQKEVLDSIRYAKRIQQSLLPNENYLNRYIP